MAHNPFSHSHALNVIIPTATKESIPQTPSERTGPQSDSFTNPDVVRGPVGDSTVVKLQQQGNNNDRAPLRTDTASDSHPLGISALNTVPSTPVQSGVEGVPPTPISPRPSRRATRTGRRFSVAEDHDEGEGDGKSDIISEAAMMLGVMAGHLVAGYMMHEEPSSEKDGHDSDDKGDA